MVKKKSIKYPSDLQIDILSTNWLDKINFKSSTRNIPIPSRKECLKQLIKKRMENPRGSNDMHVELGSTDVEGSHCSYNPILDGKMRTLNKNVDNNDDFFVVL